MESQQAEILKYIKLIIERRYLFIITSLCVMSIIVWGSYFIPKKYEAKSVIFIERNVIEDLVKGIAITPSMHARIKVLRDTMLSRSLVLDVLRKLDLDSQAKDNAELEEMIMKFQEKTNIKVRSNNNLVTVSFVNKDPVLARDYINNLVNMYVEKNIFAKRKEAYDATRFLKEQVAFFKEKMDKGEEAIIKFRQNQGIYIAMDERSVINEIKDYQKEIEKLKIRKNELTATLDSIKKQLKNEKPFTVTVFSTKEIEGTIESLENRLMQLLTRYTENYPEVIKLRAQIEALKKQHKAEPAGRSKGSTESEISTANPVYQQLKQKMMEIDAEINALNAKEKHLQRLIAEKEEELRHIPESKKKLADLEQERDSYKNVYEKLLERLGQSEVSKQMEIEDKATTFRIIEPAVLPTIPVSPNRKLLIFAGIAIGFLSGFGLVFLLDYTDSSVRTLDTLKTFGLPVLAIIPTIQSPDDLVRKRRKDILLYSITGLYMLCILGVLAMELLGLPYVEEFIGSIFMKQYL
jgi:polysaccharide chain length determinant protein (PEP-CTERM system associated)